MQTLLKNECNLSEVHNPNRVYNNSEKIEKNNIFRKSDDRKTQKYALCQAKMFLTKSVMVIE